MYREYKRSSAKNEKHTPANRLKLGSLGWHLFKLEVGQIHLQEVADMSAYKSVYNRTFASVNNKASKGRQYSCQLLHCENMHNPSKSYLIARIERLADKENDSDRPNPDQ